MNVIMGLPLTRKREQMTKAEERALVVKLNNELFNSVQGDQGESFVSDEAYTESLAQYFDFIEAQLFYSRESSKKIAGFLRKHRRLRKRFHLGETEK